MGEQEIIVRYEPEAALGTLPKLLADPVDRQRLVTLVRKLLDDERIRRAHPSPQQLSTVERIGLVLQVQRPTGVREESPARKDGAGQGEAASPKRASRRNAVTARTPGRGASTATKG